MAERRITVLALDSLGDLVLRQPLLAGLVAAGLDVTIVVRAYVAGLLPLLHPRLTPLVTTLSAWEPHASADARAPLAALADAVRASAPDVVVAAAFNRTWLDEWALALVPDARRVGLVDPAAAEASAPWAPYDLDVPRAALDLAVPCAERDHESVKNAALLRALAGRAPAADPTVTVPAPVRAGARAVLRRHGLASGRYAVGCPAGTINNDLKTWPADAYATLLRELFRDHGLPTLLVGIARERPALEAVVAAAGGAASIWYGGDDDVATLAALLAESRLYIGADSGPMHLAGAVGIPVVANVGGGHWPRFLPLARPAFVGTQKLPCFGCGWRCRFDTTRCIVERPDGFRAGLRWILGATARDLQIDEGVTLDDDLRAAIARIPAATAAPSEVARRLDHALGRSA